MPAVIMAIWLLKVGLCRAFPNSATKPGVIMYAGRPCLLQNGHPRGVDVVGALHITRPARIELNMAYKLQPTRQEADRDPCPLCCTARFLRSFRLLRGDSSAKHASNEAASAQLAREFL